MISYWCISEVRSKSYSALICVYPLSEEPKKISGVVPQYYYQKKGVVYLPEKSAIKYGVKLYHFMMTVGNSLYEKDGFLHKIFCPPNPKYPSIPRWRYWWNKARTKAVLAELVDFDPEMVILRKYEDKKLLKIRREVREVGGHHQW